MDTSQETREVDIGCNGKKTIDLYGYETEVSQLQFGGRGQSQERESRTEGSTYWYREGHQV